MDDRADDDTLAARLRELLAGTVRALQESGARTEALASYETRRPILGVRRAPVMVPVERVWRLGVLLLDAEGRLFTTGSVTRAVDPGRVTNQNPRAEERRDYRRAAFQGKFDRGDTVNWDAREIDLDPEALRRGDGAVVAQGSELLVRWNATAGSGALAPLAPYLAERAALLTAPPP
ncbi:hypothetical protein SCB71_07775 [Herbiconiux sp. KACC 21604]|uniref:hypothetical protein n=1 Tax=unclassified Herbiconiux TaxID=2618217 RepID=UPI00149202C4|nr:hypothetical protein [Herbiconiux sp. SALV-R1]QJU53178.1 hypothetical protein HL652_05740 [Herbiconiux sp. SALV-R1]WPO88125.1 hypothetical protein SCB71_07775 [Herbiconiux sp. KACC 21604]